MSESVLLVLAGGLVGVVAGLVPLALQRLWAGQDRRRAHDARALDSAIRKMMGWQDIATKLIAGSDVSSAEQALVALDAEWEADFGLIPDQEAATEIINLAKWIRLAPRSHRDSPDAMEKMSRLIQLQDRVLRSARKRRRQLA